MAELSGEEDVDSIPTPTLPMSLSPLARYHGDTEPDPNEEEDIFAMLFQQCDSGGEGVVRVDSLVEFIRKMQLGQTSSTEEVFDSQQDVHDVQYNLQMLSVMLEGNSTAGQVDQATYSHVIRMWVKDIRGRSDSSSLLEVSRLSEEEEEDLGSCSFGSGQLSGESFETSGGASSHHTDIDRQELLSTLQSQQLDNKRLQECSQQLQIQLDRSEEHVKELEADSQELARKLESTRYNLSRLEDLEGHNMALGSAVEEEREKCAQLIQQVDQLEGEIAELKEDLSSTYNKLNAVTSEREHFEAETKVLQQLLTEKENRLTHVERSHGNLESQLADYQKDSVGLSSKVAELGEQNEQLRGENAQLLTRVDRDSTMPLSSTPYRRSEAPSLHDELAGEEPGPAPQPAGGGAEEGREESVAREPSSLDDFSRVLQKARTRINQKADLMDRELDDLLSLSHSSPSSTHFASSSGTHPAGGGGGEDSFRLFERKLDELTKKKKQSEKNAQKLAAQLKHLHNENRQLKDQLADLRRRLQQAQRDQQAQRTPSPSMWPRPPGHADSDAAGLSPPTAAHPSTPPRWLQHTGTGPGEGEEEEGGGAGPPAQSPYGGSEGGVAHTPQDSLEEGEGGTPVAGLGTRSPVSAQRWTQPELRGEPDRDAGYGDPAHDGGEPDRAAEYGELARADGSGEPESTDGGGESDGVYSRSNLSLGSLDGGAKPDGGGEPESARPDKPHPRPRGPHGGGEPDGVYEGGEPAGVYGGGEPDGVYGREPESVEASPDKPHPRPRGPRGGGFPPVSGDEGELSGESYEEREAQGIAPHSEMEPMPCPRKRYEAPPTGHAPHPPLEEPADVGVALMESNFERRPPWEDAAVQAPPTDHTPPEEPVGVAPDGGVAGREVLGEPAAVQDVGGDEAWLRSLPADEQRVDERAQVPLRLPEEEAMELLIPAGLEAPPTVIPSPFLPPPPPRLASTHQLRLLHSSPAEVHSGVVELLSAVDNDVASLPCRRDDTVKGHDYTLREHQHELTELRAELQRSKVNGQHGFDPGCLLQRLDKLESIAEALSAQSEGRGALSEEEHHHDCLALLREAQDGRSQSHPAMLGAASVKQPRPVVSSQPVSASLSGTAWRLLRGVSLLLFLFLLVLLFLLLIFVLHGTIENCPSTRCPHSPLHLLFSILQPHLHYAHVGHHPM